MKQFTDDINRPVGDCLHYNLNEKESLEYIKKKVGRKISRVTLFKAKKRVLANSDANHEELFLNQFAKVGYVRIQREAIETMQKIVQHDLELFAMERSKPKKEQLKRMPITLKLKDSIAYHLDVLTQFSQGSPITARIKALVDRGSKYGPEEDLIKRGKDHALIRHSAYGTLLFRLQE
jgi:hypothetical protein